MGNQLFLVKRLPLALPKTLLVHLFKNTIFFIIIRVNGSLKIQNATSLLTFGTLNYCLIYYTCQI